MADNMAITPVQPQGITGKDVALTAGAAAVGALGGGAMYLKTPSEDAFVKAGVKLAKDSIKEVTKNLGADDKDVLENIKKASEEEIKNLKENLKNSYSDAKDALKKSADSLTTGEKELVSIMKKAKTSTALKWGGIAAAALALLTAGYLYCTKGNNAQAEQAQPENV